MPQSRQICCCGADCWTKVIAWIQIIASIILTIGLLSGFFYIVSVGESEIDRRAFGNLAFGLIIFVTVIAFLFTLVSLVMGVILLLGATERNCQYLTCWMTYAIVGILLMVVLRLTTLNPDKPFGDLLVILVSIIWSTFLTWIVYIFKGEVKDQDEGGDGSRSVVYKP